MTASFGLYEVKVVVGVDVRWGMIAAAAGAHVEIAVVGLPVAVYDGGFDYIAVDYVLVVVVVATGFVGDK